MYSFDVLVFLLIIWLTLTFKLGNGTKRIFVSIILIIFTALNLQLDQGQLIMSFPFLLFTFPLFFLDEVRHKKIKVNKKILGFMALVSSITLFILFQLGSLQYRFASILSANPEKGWEGLFGWNSFSSFLWSTNWIINYIAILVTLPLFVLGLFGIFVVAKKKSYRIILIAWGVAIIVAIWIGGYYPRRLLLVSPLFALLSALSIDFIYLKISSKLKSSRKFMLHLISWKKTIRLHTVLLIVIIIFVSLWPAYQSYEYVENIRSLKTPFIPEVVQNIYLDYWTSGYSVLPAEEFIKQNVPQNSTIYVDMSIPSHLQFLLLGFNYTILPIVNIGYGEQWNVSMYADILANKTFQGSYFLFTTSSLINWSSTVQLPWIKIGQKDTGVDYTTGDYVLYKVQGGTPVKDSDFKEISSLDSNNVWQKYFVGLSQNYSGTFNEVPQGVSLAFQGYSPEWIYLTLRQNLNTKWSNLTLFPTLNIDFELQQQDPNSAFIVDTGLINHGVTKEIFFLYSSSGLTVGNWNKTNAVYYLNTLPLGQNNLSLDISKYFEEYFLNQKASQYSVSFIAIGAASDGGSISLILKNANIAYH